MEETTHLEELKAAVLDSRIKGMPSGIEPPFPESEVAERKWNVLREDLPLPLAVLKESAVEANSRWMTRFLALSGADIAPHGKTTMAPELFHRQLADGAWGITLATVNQVQVARHYGVHRIILANQLVGKRAIRTIADELARDPDFDFYACVDSVAGVRLLVDALEEQPPGRPLQLLLEGGLRGGRAGCRSVQEALEVAEAVKRAEPLLTLRGVEGFEGIAKGETPALRKAAVDDFLELLIGIAVFCEKAGHFGEGELILTAGGSAYFDMVARYFEHAGIDRPFRVVTRSGCYLTHDSGHYMHEFDHLLERMPEAADLGEGLRPALEVWGYVQSRPEPDLCILTVGKRDISYDIGLPRPERWYRPGTPESPRALGEGHTIFDLNDQHGYLRVPTDTPLRVGDMVALGISHPCTTFDRWQVIPVVNDAYDVIGVVRTFF